MSTHPLSLVVRPYADKSICFLVATKHLTSTSWSFCAQLGSIFHYICAMNYFAASVLFVTAKYWLQELRALHFTWTLEHFVLTILSNAE